MVRFRRPAKTVEAIQFTGDWQKLCDDLGWTMEKLKERWPKSDIDWDGTFYSDGWPGRERMPLHPVPIDEGTWIIMKGGEIETFAYGEWFDEWERLDG